MESFGSSSAQLHTPDVWDVENSSGLPHDQESVSGSSDNTGASTGALASTNQSNRCRYCGRQLADRHALMHHLRHSHADKAHLKCEHCDFKTFNALGMRRHSSRCGKPASGDESISTPSQGSSAQLMTLNAVGGYPVDLHRHSLRCEQPTSGDESLSASSQSDSAKLTCNYCGLQLKHRDSWHKHLRKMHPNEAHQCEHCDFRTHSDLTLRRHSLNCNVDATVDETVLSPLECAASNLNTTAVNGLHSDEFRRNAAQLSVKLGSNRLAALRTGVSERQIKRWRYAARAGALGPLLSNEAKTDSSDDEPLSTRASLNQKVAPSTQSQSASISLERSLQPQLNKRASRPSPLKSGPRHQRPMKRAASPRMVSLLFDSSDSSSEEEDDFDRDLSAIATLNSGTLSRPRKNVVTNRGHQNALKRSHTGPIAKGPRSSRAFSPASLSENGRSTTSSLEAAFLQIFAPEDTEPEPVSDSDFEKPVKRRQHRFPSSRSLRCQVRLPCGSNPVTTHPITPLMAQSLQPYLGQPGEASGVVVSFDNDEFKKKLASCPYFPIAPIPGDGNAVICLAMRSGAFAPWPPSFRPRAMLHPPPVNRPNVGASRLRLPALTRTPSGHLVGEALLYGQQRPSLCVPSQSGSRISIMSPLVVLNRLPLVVIGSSVSQSLGFAAQQGSGFSAGGSQPSAAFGCLSQRQPASASFPRLVTPRY